MPVRIVGGGEGGGRHRRGRRGAIAHRRGQRGHQVTARRQASDAEASRRWSIERRIPVTLLLGLMLHACASVWYFARLAQTVEMQAGLQRDLREEVRNLAAKVEAFSVPAALNAARTASIEQQLAELRGRLAELERPRGTR